MKNIQQVLQSLNHIMREDTSRRFAFGYTIENASMRLWFCSRVDVLVSSSFNWMKVCRLSLLVAFVEPDHLTYRKRGTNL